MLIPKNLSIDVFENIIRNVEFEDEEDLVLSQDSSKMAFGSLASAIQAINTWGRKSSERIVTLSLTEETLENQINEVMVRPHKFIAVMWSRTVRMKKYELINIKKSFNFAAKNVIEKQGKSAYGQQYGGLCWFVFVDHSTKGFDENFYTQDEETMPAPRQNQQIQNIIKSMIEKSLQVVGGGRPPIDDDIDLIGRLFTELFLNTHEHGSRGEARRDWIRPGLRTIYTNGINLTEHGIAGYIKDETNLSNYLSNKKFSIGKRFRFVEISIIDSGLGFCGRWLADHPESGSVDKMSIEDEYGIFKKCFSFRSTSSAKENKGHGLPVVMDRLTKLNGFMRVRSGRLSLYRNFITDPYEINNECDFSDWEGNNGTSSPIVERAYAVGVAITLLIPVEDK